MVIWNSQDDLRSCTFKIVRLWKFFAYFFLACDVQLCAMIGTHNERSIMTLKATLWKSSRHCNTRYELAWESTHTLLRSSREILRELEDRTSVREIIKRLSYGFIGIKFRSMNRIATESSDIWLNCSAFACKHGLRSLIHQLWWLSHPMEMVLSLARVNRWNLNWKNEIVKLKTFFRFKWSISKVGYQ